MRSVYCIAAHIRLYKRSGKNDTSTSWFLVLFIFLFEHAHLEREGVRLWVLMLPCYFKSRELELLLH